MLLGKKTTHHQYGNSSQLLFFLRKKHGCLFVWVGENHLWVGITISELQDAHLYAEDHQKDDLTRCQKVLLAICSFWKKNIIYCRLQVVEWGNPLIINPPTSGKGHLCLLVSEVSEVKRCHWFRLVNQVNWRVNSIKNNDCTGCYSYACPAKIRGLCLKVSTMSRFITISYGSKDLL